LLTPVIKASLQWEMQSHGNSSCSDTWISEEALYRLLAVHIRNNWTPCTHNAHWSQMQNCERQHLFDS